MKNNSISALAADNKKGGAVVPSGSEQEKDETAGMISPESSKPVGYREQTAREECSNSEPADTTEQALDTSQVQAAPSVRDKILAARKAPVEVGGEVGTWALGCG